MSHRLFTFTLVGLALAALVSAQQAKTDAAKAPEKRPPGELLSVSGDVPKPLSLDAKAFAELPHTEIRVKDKAGRDAVYKGVLLREILQQAGAPIGNNRMHGENVAKYALAEASDGYRAAYALAELDDDIAERNVLVADLKDGKPLDANDGSLRIVIPGDKKGARWIRQLISVKVQTPPGGREAPHKH